MLYGDLRIEPTAEPPITSTSITYRPPRHSNGYGYVSDNVEAESDLSDPDSSVRSLPCEGLGRVDRVIDDAPTHSNRNLSPLCVVSDNEAEAVRTSPDEPVSSHPSKRKRSTNPVNAGTIKSEISRSVSEQDENSSFLNGGSVPKANRQTLVGIKGVLLGHWRNSNVPDEDRKHAVVGFIDVRERLRTRIQPQTKEGDSLAEDYPLPPGPGGSWVTFERIVFSDHLVGLDHLQIKEYIRLRFNIPPEETEEERKEAERDAVKEAIRRVNESPLLENQTATLSIAQGVELPEHLSLPTRTELKRRRLNSGFAPVNQGPTKCTAPDPELASSQQRAALQSRFSVGPLPGSRPTRILLGYWKPSDQSDPKDRHAVYGIFGQNDMFRVKVVRETRDGRYVDGNFPTGAGALWISFENVEFEDHLKDLNRQEIKEYCRIRQHQLGQGETTSERVTNESQAVLEARERTAAALKQMSNSPATVLDTNARRSAGPGPRRARSTQGVPDLRQSRRTESRPNSRSLRHSLNENEMSSVAKFQSVDAAERASTLARREIARAEAAQGRADRHAMKRERAAAVTTVAQPVLATTNGRVLFHESENMQRLNKVWAQQESLRIKASAEDAKVYDGIKYERKLTGPFSGKLVSQGMIISIDGEDYVEYRVLTKPSFF